MELISRLDGTTKIIIDIKPNIHYGYMLSGGMDSAVCLYLCLMDAKEKGFQPDIKVYNYPKDSGYLWVPKILDLLRTKTGMQVPDQILLSSQHHVGHAQRGTEAVKEMYKLYKPDAFICAANMNPPELMEIADDRWGEGHYNVRIPSFNERQILPFYDITKEHIVDLMFRFGIEELMNITHSCTMQDVGRCNGCFQCAERQLAFDKAGRIDTGTN